MLKFACSVLQEGGPLRVSKGSEAHYSALYSEEVVNYWNVSTELFNITFNINSAGLRKSEPAVTCIFLLSIFSSHLLQRKIKPYNVFLYNVDMFKTCKMC